MNENFLCLEIVELKKRIFDLFKRLACDLYVKKDCLCVEEMEKIERHKYVNKRKFSNSLKVHAITSAVTSYASSEEGYIYGQHKS